MAGRREFYEELPSTQDRAIALARDGAESGSRVVARRQHAGRGREARSWSSPAGGLYLSVILGEGVPSSILPLVVGSELAAAIAERYGVRLRLKWPNDLYSVDGGARARKLSGMLLDIVPKSEGGSVAVLGIGMNAHLEPATLAPELRASAVGLEELAVGPVDLDRLEEIVVSTAVAASIAVRSEGGRAAALARCSGLLYGVGQEVTVDGVHAGTVRGLAPDGALEVETRAGATRLLSGDVRFGVGQ